MSDETTLQDQIKKDVEEQLEENLEGEAIVCPHCKKDVEEWDDFYICSGNKKDDDSCEFILSKHILGAEITVEDLESICENGETERYIEMYSEEKKKKFKAKIIWNDEKQKTEFKFKPAVKKILKSRK